MTGTPRRARWAAFYTLCCNPTQPPFDKKEARQAMQYALDRDTIVKKVLFALSEPTYAPWPKTSPAYDPRYDTAYRYDLDTTKALIARAGFANGLQATLLTPTNFPELGDMAQILQADLAKIGSKLEIKPMGPAQWYPKLNTGDYQLTFSFAGNDHKYPTRVTLSAVYRLVNNVFYKDNPPVAYARAVKEAQTTLDPAKQKDAFQRMTEALLDESWAQAVAFRYTLFGTSKAVKRLDWSVDDQVRLARVSVEQ